MANKRHKHARIIDIIGGEAIRERYQLSRQRLSKWRKEGIPWTHRAHFAAFARQYERQLKFRLPRDFLTPPDLPENSRTDLAPAEQGDIPASGLGRHEDPASGADA
jgi:hypothetical protein